MAAVTQTAAWLNYWRTVAKTLRPKAEFVEIRALIARRIKLLRQGQRSVLTDMCEISSAESGWPKIVTCGRYDDDRAFRPDFCSDWPTRQKRVRLWHRLFGCPTVVIQGFVFTKCDCGVLMRWPG